MAISQYGYIVHLDEEQLNEPLDCQLQHEGQLQCQRGEASSSWQLECQPDEQLDSQHQQQEDQLDEPEKLFYNFSRMAAFQRNSVRRSLERVESERRLRPDERKRLELMRADAKARQQTDAERRQKNHEARQQVDAEAQQGEHRCQQQHAARPARPAAAASIST